MEVWVGMDGNWVARSRRLAAVWGAAALLSAGVVALAPAAAPAQLPPATVAPEVPITEPGTGQDGNASGFIIPPPSATGPFYVATGDSLAAGFAASAGKGYVDNLLTYYGKTVPGLQLANFGCSGETTQTMMHGAICSYPEGSQLAATEAFLRAHRGQVSVITIDIGGNDVIACGLGPNFDVGCAVKSLTPMSANLRVILSRIRSAAGASVPIIGTNYFNPFLVQWMQGPAGQALARQTDGLVPVLSQKLADVYGEFSVPVADMEGAFQTREFTPNVTRSYGTVPLNVARACDWLDMTCSKHGVNFQGDDANDIGYMVIAHAFEAVSPPALQKQDPEAAFFQDVMSGVVPLAVRFDASWSRGAGLTYSWDFGDGSPPESAAVGANPDHTYAVPGNFTLTLTVIDEHGASDTIEGPIVAALAPPLPSKPDVYSVAADQTLEVAAPGVLANDGVAGARDDLRAFALRYPNHGVFQLRDDGAFSYTPDPGFAGADGFTYVASGAAGQSEETAVTITVEASGAPPSGPGSPAPPATVLGAHAGNGTSSAAHGTLPKTGGSPAGPVSVALALLVLGLALTIRAKRDAPTSAKYRT
jgi:PKD repeat protein